ncbi:kinesin-like protein KIN-14I isoform X2 [Macadamia integrifolia]|uniref:kinesin-like protein KIN-14I isoform X2 n=1 Tax=Macadamia integrifolia TaxID=60698 RepID=UPI001C4E94B1|nr:kinesin-like protein KIN-14I isoform X2 [Macadamia integrifolia]
MATEGILSFSMASVVEDVLQQHGTRLSDIDLASRKAEEAAFRRYEAAGWLRKMVGLVAAKDLPAEPSEDEFRLGLRSGIILCNVLNKVQPGAVPKVVESSSDTVNVPDGAALSAYQYFENVRNFLIVVQEIGLPTFEASDLEQGGKSSRIVNCVLELKSYSDSKQFGGKWKFGGSIKSASSGKYVVRKNSELFTNSLSRSQSTSERSMDGLSPQPSSNGDLAHALTEMTTTQSVNMLVRAALSDKNPEEVPALVESLLSKVMEEFERRLASQNELMKTAALDLTKTGGDKTLLRTASCEVKVEVNDENVAKMIKKKSLHEKSIHDEESKKQIMKQQMLLDRQQRDIHELRHTLSTTKAGMHFMQMKCLEEFNTLGRHMHGLAVASSGYHRVLEENRKLYNQVQDLKGSIRVYCRVRPFLPGQPNRLSNVDHIEEGNITILTPSKYGKEGRRSFTFNKVFGPTASQEEVFSDTRPLIRSVLDGYNVCIFAYGQTGSGKTHTMTGPRELTEKSQGVNYRALNDLFLLSEQRKDSFCYDVSVQMIEIYNEQVRDLLVTDGFNKRLEIRNSAQGGLNVPDANLVPVASTFDVLDLMNLGQRNRAVSSTALNDRSSRSHSCLTVHVQGRDLTSGAVLRGCMHLVDLAGSERVDKSEVTGDRLKEAQHINKSLSALGDVISSLAQKNSHVPYRNSKLTQLLQDSLGGQAKTLMFVHISPEADAIGETISTLKFAERVSTVELGAARVNKDSTDVKELKEQIASLKAALARKEEEPEHLQHSIPYTPEQHIFKLSESPVFKPSGSPLHNNRQIGGDVSSAHSDSRQPMEDVGNIEVRNNFVTMSKRSTSLDPQELLMHSSSWPPVSGLERNFQKEDEKETGSGDWVDKVMVNKQEVVYGDEKPLGCWDGENGQLPEHFYQRFLLDSKVYPEKRYNRVGGNRKESQDFDLQRSRFDTATTYDSDELEVATSDSSEPDMLWQFNNPKVTRIPNGVGSKIKKPQPKAYKSPEIRSSIPTLSPSPSRKSSNGVGPPVHRSGRQPASVDMKRRAGNGK